MELELIETHDNGRKVIPFNTGRVQIGRCWTPKLTPQQASCGSRHTRRGRPYAKWSAVSFLAVLALLVISGRV